MCCHCNTEPTEHASHPAVPNPNPHTALSTYIEPLLPSLTRALCTVLLAIPAALLLHRYIDRVLSTAVLVPAGPSFHAIHIVLRVGQHKILLSEWLNEDTLLGILYIISLNYSRITTQHFMYPPSIISFSLDERNSSGSSSAAVPFRSLRAQLRCRILWLRRRL
jgi:hypothetical protein